MVTHQSLLVTKLADQSLLYAGINDEMLEIILYNNYLRVESVSHHTILKRYSITMLLGFKA